MEHDKQTFSVSPDDLANRYVRYVRTETMTSKPPSEMDRQVGGDRIKIGSDGLSTDYYKLPEHATELRHLISHKAMSKSRGDIFKACYRLGEKEGVDLMYDLNKMKFFIQDLIEMHERGEHL